MGSFRTIADPLAAFLKAGLPWFVVLAGLLVFVVLFRSRNRRAVISVIILAAGFSLLDALLLLGLPWLGLSFGPVEFPFFILLAGRAALCMVWLLLLAISPQPEAARSSRPFWLTNVLATLLVAYGFYIEPFNLRVTKIQVPAEGLRQPVRIVQLSDVHVERLTPRERALVPLVQGLQPDLIVFTGDYLNLSYLHDPIAQKEARNLFARLSAPYGVFAIDGSVDSPEFMYSAFANPDFSILEDEVERVAVPGGEIYLIGINDWEYERDSGMLTRLAAEQIPADAFTMLLYHTPDLIHHAERSGVDLYLAGHTHGGQICAPLYGAIVTASRFGKAYESGRYQVGETTLYVSRGIGMEGGRAPRARFLAPPEVVVIDLVPVPEK